ncbi:conserved hypothetical protein [uncultured Desulfobacterium sp.]|uniref:PilZ domain-containing protein n=1 Tax=uncultured Desulfobacterium sp. TaxID=201089 RepID=A0A445MZ96_9BACT|nr:conserved hypothetical protein [uncultured Desulfobacterium sp.]
MSNDNRRFTRIRFGVQAELTVNGEVYHVDQIINLSIGGCLLSLNEEFKTGSQCQVKIMMDPTNSELNIVIEGEIVRCEQRTVAVKFTAIDPDSLFHLRRVVLYNAPDTKLVEDEIQRHPGLV